MEVVAANSNAEAARLVAEEADGRSAAVAPALAAKIYGLDVLASDIEDHPENETRFVLVGRDGIPAPTGHDKSTIVVFQRTDRAGSLLAILQEFAARAINLTKLESRPTKKALGDYCFIIDLEGHLADELVADCLRDAPLQGGRHQVPRQLPRGRRARPRGPPRRRRGLAGGRRVDRRPASRAA